MSVSQAIIEIGENRIIVFWIEGKLSFVLYLEKENMEGDGGAPTSQEKWFPTLWL